jgi:hypothetical protein
MRNARRTSLERACPFRPINPYKGDTTLKNVMLRFTGPLPDLDRIYPADLALPSDAQFLRDNPEAIARVRAFEDRNQPDRRIIFLAVRVLDPTQPDGWRTAYHEGHSAHCGGHPFGFWATHASFANANRLAMVVLAGDAVAAKGDATTVLPLLVVPADAAQHMDPFWRRQFASLNVLGLPQPSLAALSQSPQSVLFQPNSIAPIPDDGRAPVPLAFLRDEIERALKLWRHPLGALVNLNGKQFFEFNVWTVRRGGRMVLWEPDADLTDLAVAMDIVGYAVAFPAEASQVPCTGFNPQPRNLDPASAIATQLALPGDKLGLEWGVLVVFGPAGHEAARAVSKEGSIRRRGKFPGRGRLAWRFIDVLCGSLAVHLAAASSRGTNGPRTSDALFRLARGIASVGIGPFRWVYD